MMTAAMKTMGFPKMKPVLVSGCLSMVFSVSGNLVQSYGSEFSDGSVVFFRMGPLSWRHTALWRGILGLVEMSCDFIIMSLTAGSSYFVYANTML